MRAPLIVAASLILIPAATAHAAPAPAAHAAPAPAATPAVCGWGITISGTSGDDVLDGTPGDDVFCAGDGDDVVNGNGGNDTVIAGPGDDRVTTGSGNDTIVGGSGSDTLASAAGDDRVLGDNYTWLPGQHDQDDPEPDGPDLIYAGLGSDSVSGGAGHDVIFTGGGGGNTLAALDWAEGNDGNDVIMSDFRYPIGTDHFYGGAGDDLLWPNPTRLSLLGNYATGGAGHDVIILLNGGHDTATMGETPSTVQLPLGQSCSVALALPGGGDKSTVTCSLPIKVKIPGLVDGVTASMSIDSAGRTKTSVNVQPSEKLASAKKLVDMARNGFPTEFCICDPQLPGRFSGLSDMVRT